MSFNQLIIKILYTFEAVFFKKDNRCPYCFSKQYKVIYRKKVIDICRCLNCCLYWTNPIFRFWRFYDILYAAEGLTTKPDKAKLPALLASSFKDSGKDYHKVIQWMKSISPGRELLEFGCSWGYFLYQARLQGFKVKGVEVSKRRSEFAKKHLDLDIATRIDNLTGEKFDIIFSAHTLEHVGYSLREIFERFWGLLRPDGLLIIEVPHLDLSRGKGIFSIMGAVHPLGFSRDFFEKNLSAHGLRVNVYGGFKEIIKDYESGEDNLVVICRKIQDK